MPHSNRRTFLRDSLLVTSGACVGGSVPWLLRQNLDQNLEAQDKAASVNYEQRIKDLGLVLPTPSKPIAVYVPAIITGNLLYTAGHIPLTAEGKPLQGQVGGDFTLQQGADAARTVGLSILSTVRNKLGTLDRVVQLVKVLGMVNCTAGFTDQPKVINGFSELMVQVFGETAGRGARSAVGVGSLPANVPVEIEAIFEIRPA